MTSRNVDRSAAAAEPSPSPGSGEIDWACAGKFLYLIGLIDRGVQGELQRTLVEHGLTPTEYSVLGVLHMVPGLSNAELARRSLVTPQSMNEVIVKLERRGYVRRRQHAEHGRIRMVEVTWAGLAVISAARPHIQDLEADLLAGIPAEDVPVVRTHLLGVLERVKAR